MPQPELPAADPIVHSRRPLNAEPRLATLRAVVAA